MATANNDRSGQTGAATGVEFIQNGNNFLHGVRGVIWVNGEIAGAVQDITATEDGEEDLVYVMGSRYIQAKERKNIVVNGSIKTLVFDPTAQKLLKLTDPTKSGDTQKPELFLEGTNSGGEAGLSNVFTHADTQLAFARGTSDGYGALMPLFDIQVMAKTVGEDGILTYSGFFIQGCMVKSYEIMFNKDTWWIGNITFIADKMERLGSVSSKDTT